MYRLEIKRTVAKEIKRIPEPARGRILAAIRKLVHEPYPHGSKKLPGEYLYRVRVGSYRIFYDVDDDQLIVFVLRARHRRDVYRSL